MVFEDELPPLKRSRFSIWFWRIFKILMVLGVMFVIAIMVLTRVGGNDDNLRMGLERLVGRTAGDYPARVGILHGMVFFPYIRVHAEQVIIMPRPLPSTPAPAEGAAPEDAPPPAIDDRPPLMVIDTLMFSRGFWDAFLLRRRVEGVRVEGIQTSPGFLLPRAIRDGYLALDEDLYEGKPGAEFSGKYGDHDFKLLMAVDFNMVNSRPAYSVPEDPPFSLHIGPLRGHGKIVRGENKGIALAFDELTLSPAGKGASILPLRGTVEASNGLTSRNVYLALANEGNAISLARKSDGGKTDVSIEAERLTVEDLGALVAFITQVMDIYRADEPGLMAAGAYDLSLDIKELRSGAHALGTVSLAGRMGEDHVLKSTALKGTIEGRALDGTITLDTHEKAAVLAAEIKAGDAAMSVSAEGTDLEALYGDMAGHCGTARFAVAKALAAADWRGFARCTNTKAGE